MLVASCILMYQGGQKKMFEKFIFKEMENCWNPQGLCWTMCELFDQLYLK